MKFFYLLLLFSCCCHHSYGQRMTLADSIIQGKIPGLNIIPSSAQNIQKDKDLLEKAFAEQDTVAAKSVFDQWAKASRNKRPIIYNSDEKLVYDVYRKFIDNFLAGKLEGFKFFYFNKAHYLFLQSSMAYFISPIPLTPGDKHLYFEGRPDSYLTLSASDSMIHSFYPVLNRTTLINENGVSRFVIFYDKDKERKCLMDFLGYAPYIGGGMIDGNKANTIPQRCAFINSIIGIDTALKWMVYGRPFVSKIILDKNRDLVVVKYILNEATYLAFYYTSKLKEPGYFPKSVLISRA